MTAWSSLLKPVPELFFEKPADPEGADYIVLSASLDETASYRSGSRLAPQAIRSASHYMESLSLRTGLDWGDLSLADVGEVEGMGGVEGALRNVEEVARGVASLGKIPVMLGGEHTVTLGALRALKPGLVVVFDAHLDLRDELFGERLCHATWLRRAHEEQGFKVAVLGARAVSREEIDYAERSGVTVVTALDVKRRGAQCAVDAVNRLLEDAGSAYLSVDFDAVDPSEAPAVGNPSPEGISVTQLLDAVSGFISPKFRGFDFTEVSPSYDSGQTAVQAAYTILETLYAHTASRRA